MPKESGIHATATIDRVIDGDTIVARITGGDPLARALKNRLVHLRLINCWAPENSTPQGESATRAMHRLAPEGAEVEVIIPTSNFDIEGDHIGKAWSMGRVLCHVYRKGDDESLSEHMVGMGHATREKAR